MLIISSSGTRPHPERAPTKLVDTTIPDKYLPPAVLVAVHTSALTSPTCSKWAHQFKLPYFPLTSTCSWPSKMLNLPLLRSLRRVLHLNFLPLTTTCTPPGTALWSVVVVAPLHHNRLIAAAAVIVTIAAPVTATNDTSSHVPSTPHGLPLVVPTVNGHSSQRHCCFSLT